MLFTVLQECATDSEELIYPIRAPSSCSAPPDLLLTGDRNKDNKGKSPSSHVDAISPDQMLLEVSFEHISKTLIFPDPLMRKSKFIGIYM